MKVSVIIPTYNRGRYLPEAIESVLRQTMSDFELIVVDDASTDNTEEVVKPYLDQIVYIRKAVNEGFSEARNTGILHASGEYIAYLDDDDAYLPFKIELQTLILDHNPEVGMVFSDFTAFSDDGYSDEFHIQEYHESAYRRGNVTYENLYASKIQLNKLSYGHDIKDAMPAYFDRASIYSGNIYNAYRYNTIVFTNSMMFRKELVEKIGLQEKKFGLFCDLEYAMRVCAQSDVSFVDIPTYKLRYHPEQISTTNNRKGGLVNIHKQKDLLLVTKYHTKYNAAYYTKNKQLANEQIAKLYRAAAIPKLSYQSGSRITDKRNSKHARKYLLMRMRLGYSDTMLLAMTFFPHIIRRVYFKLIQMYR